MEEYVHDEDTAHPLIFFIIQIHRRSGLACARWQAGKMIGFELVVVCETALIRWQRILQL